jgi:sulfatase modifying factor 1
VLLGLVWVSAACGARTALELSGEVDADASDGASSCGDWGQACCMPVKCKNGLTCDHGTCIAEDAGGPPPSCAPGGPGMTTCGDGGDGGAQSCCASLEVNGGTFFRTYTNSGTGATGEADPATVSGFRLDKYDVTVGRFRPFVSAWNGGWRPAPGSGKHVHLNQGQGLANSASPGSYETGWLPSDNDNVALSSMSLDCPGSAGMGTWTPTPATNEKLPINCVNWYDAYAFCIWDGGFLPSEAEWEYAAAGGSEQREYPWGSTDPGDDNDYAIYACYFPSGSQRCSYTSNMNLPPVGTAKLGASLWGHADLGGEMNQWNLDNWNGSYVNPCVNCAYQSSAGRAVLRGGAFDEPVLQMSPFARNLNALIYVHPEVGVRCARTP